MTQTVGFIGTGMIGGALARLAASSGYNVIVSNSRGPEVLAGFVAELGPTARAATVDELAEAADLFLWGHTRRCLPTVWQARSSSTR